MRISLTSLELFQNPALMDLECKDNSLTSLNIANGNNSNILNNNFYTTNNSNLTCIEVDDASFSTTNWTNIDAVASFSENCNPISVSSITVTGQAGATTIITQGGTLQMESAVLLLSADDATYTWSVDNANATISTTGMLTAIADGSNSNSK